MGQQTLRELAKGFANGEISKDIYRKARTELIDGILLGEIKLQENVYQPPVVQPQPEEKLENTERSKREKQKADEPLPAITEPEIFSGVAPEGPQYLTWAWGSGIVVLLIIIVFLFLPESDETDKKTAAISGPQTSSGSADSASSGQHLIREFLQSKNWSNDKLDDFVTQWQSLPPEQRTMAEDSVEIGQLTNAIYKKFLEEKALSGIGDPGKALAKQVKLISFAEAIGISDERLVLPDSE